MKPQKNHQKRTLPLPWHESHLGISGPSLDFFFFFSLPSLPLYRPVACAAQTEPVAHKVETEMSVTVEALHCAPLGAYPRPPAEGRWVMAGWEAWPVRVDSWDTVMV